MATAQGSISVHQDEQALTFRVAGRATMQLAPVFLSCANQAIAANIPAVNVVLRDCSYMDSTFLGSLLSLKRSTAAAGATRLAILSPSEQCKRLLEQMGLDAFLPVGDADAPEPAGPWRDMEDASSAGAVQETVVRAHQELAETPAPGCEQFKSIASKLAAAWAKQKGQ